MTTWAGSSTAPPDEAGSSTMALPDDNDKLNHVVANVLKQLHDGPLVA